MMVAQRTLKPSFDRLSAYFIRRNQIILCFILSVKNESAL